MAFMMAVELLQTTDFPFYPLQRAATDLFDLKGQSASIEEMLMWLNCHQLPQQP